MGASPGTSSPRRTVRVSRHAALRLSAGVALRWAGVGGAWGAGLGIVGVVCTRVEGWTPGVALAAWGWPIVVVGPIVLGAVAGAAASVVRWSGVPRGAAALDRRLGLQDRLATAIALSRGEAGAVEQLAIADAESTAARVSVRGAVPVRLGRGWIACVLLGAVGLTAWRWAPSVAPWGASSPVRREVAVAPLATKQAQDAVSEASRAVEEFADASAARQIEALKQVEQELAKPGADRSVITSAARAVGEAGDQVRRRAAQTQAEQQRLLEKLAESARGSADAGVPEAGSMRELSRALRQQDAAAAAEAARALSGQWDEMPASERAAVEKQLRELASAMEEWDRAKAAEAARSAAGEKGTGFDGTSQPNDAQRRDTPPASDDTGEPRRADRERREQPQPANPPAGESAAHEALQKNPDAGGPQGRPHEGPPKTAASEHIQPENQPHPQPAPGEGSGKPADQPAAAPRPGDSDRPSTEPKSASESRGDKAPPNNPDRERPAGEGARPNTSPRDGQNPGTDPSLADGKDGQPRPDDASASKDGQQQRTAPQDQKQRPDAPADGKKQQGSGSPDSSQTQSGGDQNGKDQGVKPDGQPAQRPAGDPGTPTSHGGQAEPQRQPRSDPGSRPTQGGSGRGEAPDGVKQPTESGVPAGDGKPDQSDGKNSGGVRSPRLDRSAPGDKKAGENQDGSLDERLGDRPGGQPGGLPKDLPSREVLEQLAERLKGSEVARRQAQEAMKQGRGLQEQAQKMLDQASPEQRQALEKLARELSQNGNPGGSGRPLGADGGDGAIGPSLPVRERPTSGADTTTTVPVDARHSAPGGSQRVISDILNDQPMPTEAPSAGGGLERAFQQAAQGAESGIENQTVPAERSELVRRVFQRYQKRVKAAPVPPEGGGELR